MHAEWWHSHFLPGRPIRPLSLIPTLIPPWTNGGECQRPLGLWKSWKAVYSRTLPDPGEPSGPHPVCATNRGLHHLVGAFSRVEFRPGGMQPALTPWPNRLVTANLTAK